MYEFAKNYTDIINSLLNKSTQLLKTSLVDNIMADKEINLMIHDIHRVTRSNITNSNECVAQVNK